MKPLSFDTDFACNNNSEKKATHAFNQNKDKSVNIQFGMTPKEISDVVSEKLIAVVREQFEVTKKQFAAK
uniref:hypothetical protein n=1 Tax=Roseivirga sp. TaxID=1964215 RepID=UPI00404777BE